MSDACGTLLAMAGGWNVKTGTPARQPEAACGCGSPGFSHYRSLHPGRDQLTDESEQPEDTDGQAMECADH